MNKPIIEVKNIGKRYQIIHQAGRYVALRDVVANVFKKPFSFLLDKAKSVTGLKKKEEFWALRNVNFTVNKGEVVGIIGHNGAGKSTLLKILSQITPPTEGEIILRGTVGSLLEVGTGFHPELSGRENIFLNGAILGMRRHEIAKKFDQIVEFAGIEKFLDTPVKYYSSGMYVRLAFSVAAHMEPDILIIDEVLAVGDAEFQKKCLGKMDEITKKDGRTILFVSHNMGAIQQLCSRTILIKHGAIQNIGPTEQIIDSYIKDLSHIALMNVAQRKDRRGTGEMRIVNAHVSNPGGQLIHGVISGDDVLISLEYVCEPGKSFENVVVGMGIVSSKGEGVSIFHTEMTRTEFGTISGSGMFTCHIKRLPLVPGTYFINARITSHGNALDQMENIISLEVLNGDYFGTGVSMKHSLVYIDHSWENRPKN